MVEDLNFARLAYAGVTNVGLTTTQGDIAQYTDQVRNSLGIDGTGVTVGVISDSYEISASASRTAAQDVASGDLPANVNVLAESPLNPNQVIDEGRAMLQIVHDVAPGADLAFHTAGVSQIGMANAINNLRTTGNSDIIVDDILFLAEPMFQDGIIAQAATSAVNAGVAYFSAAGNQARRSYESAFNAGGQVNIGGVLETVHVFDTGTNDILQRVTVPIGGLFLVSFQWDAPFASTGGAGANSDLNIYLVQGGTSIIVEQARTNNIGGDAVEILFFPNTTGTTQFDILITSAAGPLPGVIKYVDFGIGVTYNEYLTNSSTLYGHANAQGVVGVGAASFLDTPEFGTDPPEIQSFSALGGTPIHFDTAGTRLMTPLVREKPDVVGPDGGNTTFFGTDIAGDPDTFPNFFGTSAAAPHVAGLAALLLDAAPSLTPTQIAQLLSASAVDMDDPVLPGFQTGFDFATGHGLVNGVAAMNATQVSQGDYNGDGVVDAGDYVFWRKRLGSSVANYATPDGSGNAVVDQADYNVWRSHFGQTFPVPGAGSGSAASVSELAVTSENVQPATKAENSQEAPNISSTTSEAIRFDLTTNANTTLSLARPERVNLGASVTVGVRRDAALLALLSSLSADGFDDQAGTEMDFHRQSDDRDRYHDAVDTVFDDLYVPLARSATKSLPAVV